MKTTELYIEQVLIGSLIILIAVLPWLPELWERREEIDAAGAVIGASLALGLAFWLGIPFDRFADTLSERLERHNRLQFALEKWVGKELPTPKPAPDDSKLNQDIFAEDHLRLKGLRDKDAVVNWIEYHRSRIRLARALAVYGPALTLSLTLTVSRSSRETPASVICLWLSGVAAGYCVWAALSNPPRSLRKKANSSPVLGAFFGTELPRTDHPRFLQYAAKWHRVDVNQETKTSTLREAARGGHRVWSDEWLSLTVPVFLLVAAVWLGVYNGNAPGWTAFVGVGVTVISAWSWWRISFTYRTYLYYLSNSEGDKESGCHKGSSYLQKDS